MIAGAFESLMHMPRAGCTHSSCLYTLDCCFWALSGGILPVPLPPPTASASPIHCQKDPSP